MPRPASTRVCWIAVIFAGVFWVENVNVLLLLAMVPMGMLMAEFVIAATTCEGMRLKYWSLFGSRRTWNWRDGAPSSEMFATPGTSSREGTSVFVTYSDTSPRLAAPPATPN